MTPMSEANAVEFSANGLSTDALAVSAFRVFARSLNGPDDWDDADHHVWERTARKVTALIDNHLKAHADLSAKRLAMFTLAWAMGSEDYAEPWEKEPEPRRIAWEAVGRHLVNCLSREKSEVNFTELEDGMVARTREKILSLEEAKS